jgi:hypothetical protein
MALVSTSTYLPLIRQELHDFLMARQPPEVLEKNAVGQTVCDPHEAYSESPAYQMYSIEFHDDPQVYSFIDALLLNSPDTASFIDVGCCTGVTGLCLAMAGRYVTFHDYEGLGPDFVKYMLEKHNLRGEFVPYGLPVRRHSIAVALDVLEHSSSHTSMLTWLTELGDNVALTYPVHEYRPPFINYVDQYVDDPAIMVIAELRYAIVFTVIANGRRFLVYKPKIEPELEPEV